MPDLLFKIMMNVGNPDRAFRLPVTALTAGWFGATEFIINRMIACIPGSAQPRRGHDVKAGC